MAQNPKRNPKLLAQRKLKLHTSAQRSKTWKTDLKSLYKTGYATPFPFPPFHTSYQSDPDGIRTRVAGVKGLCPRPLDDGAKQDLPVYPPGGGRVKGRVEKHAGSSRELAAKTGERRARPAK